MSTAIIEALEPDAIIAKYGVDTTQIDAAKLEYAGLDATIPAEYKKAIEGRAKFRGTRLAIEKRRKELNSDALEYTKQVNGAAKTLTTLVEPTEEDLDRIIKAADKLRDDARREKEDAARREIEEAARLKAEAAAQAERDRIAAEDARIKAEREAMKKQIAEQQEALAKQQRELGESRAREAAEREARLALEQKERDVRDCFERERLAQLRREEEARQAVERLQIAERERVAREQQEIADAKQREAEKAEGLARAERERLQREEDERQKELRTKRFHVLIRLVRLAPEHTGTSIWNTKSNDVTPDTEVHEPYRSTPVAELESLVVRLEFERQRAREEKDRKQAEEDRIAELERQAALEARREALNPDCVKLRDFAQAIRDVRIPDFATDEFFFVCNQAIETMLDIATSLESRADNLTDPVDVRTSHAGDPL